MESSHRPQGDKDRAVLGGSLGELGQSPHSEAVANLVPELLGVIGEGLVVLSAVSEAPIWHNQPARQLLGLSPESTTTWEQWVTQIGEQLVDGPQVGQLLQLPIDETSPVSGRLLFHSDRAVDWTLRKLSSLESRWLLLVRDVTPLRSAERSVDRSDTVLQNVVEEQQHLLHMIRQLGTPVLPIYQRIVVLPLVGHIDSGRAEHVMDAVLSAIVRYSAEVVIIDITGVSVVDTAVANSLLQTVRAADLIGTLSILVGISAEVARSMVHLGVGLDRVVTRRDLQAGIAYALRYTGHTIVKIREDIDWLSTFVGSSQVDDSSAATTKSAQTESAREEAQEPSNIQTDPSTSTDPGALL